MSSKEGKSISWKNSTDFPVFDQWFFVNVIEKEGGKEYLGRRC